MVTALGIPTVPPWVLVQFVPFIVGPFVGNNAVTGAALDSGLRNDWKISASCNGVGMNAIAFASFELIHRWEIEKLLEFAEVVEARFEVQIAAIRARDRR